ncbi:MAG: hypothetical protein Q8M43_07855 [Sulfuricurvum sp.]|uniref:hypothetical protein n=1 Tax=Sulfuricurvum sp. TaxID=2025608 RepID=UPI0027334883|nr:hypothetical protein [Sulfuricurvum sp.]MDP3291928.1 hypothetical protein [Sulfuricurvum sp.]
MKKFNLFKEIIIVAKDDFLRAANSAKRFAVRYDGKIVFEPFEPDLIAIYEGSIPPLSPLATNLSRPISEMLGKDYRIVEDEDRLLIKASGAWQSIIGYNQKRALYDDTTGDGIAEFSDKVLEDMGWHATEFNVGYREIVEQFEEKCEGILLCIEQEEPYQFSGLGFVFDIENAREIGFDYCVASIKDKLENDDDFATLTDDEEEAALYFKIPL